MNGAAAAPDQLEPEVRALFASLAHAGELRGAAGETAGAAPVRILAGEAGREDLGTRVRFMLRMDAHRVLEARYRAYGCPHTLAACEWLARRLEGRGAEGRGAEAGGAPGGGVRGLSLQALLPDTPLDWAARLGVPAAKLGRLLVIEDALRAALAPLGAEPRAG